MDDSLCDTFYVLRRSDEHIICTYTTYTYKHIHTHIHSRQCSPCHRPRRPLFRVKSSSKIFLTSALEGGEGSASRTAALYPRERHIYYVRTHICNTYIHTHLHTHTYIHTQQIHTNYITLYNTYIHTHTHINTYTYIHTYMYIHTHTYIHTYIHTQTVYDYLVTYITLTTVSNIRARMLGTKPTYQIYVLKRTVLCQVLTIFLLSPFLS